MMVQPKLAEYEQSLQCGGAAFNNYPYTRMSNAMESLILPSGPTVVDVGVIST